MPSGGKLKSVDQIAKNLLKVIIWMSNEITDIYNPDNLVIPEQAFRIKKTFLLHWQNQKKRNQLYLP